MTKAESEDLGRTLRPRERFTSERLWRLLRPPLGRHEYESKLRLGSDYMQAASDCLEVDRLQVVDPHSLLIRFEEVFLTTNRLVRDFDVGHSSRIEGIEAALNLSQNVVLLGTISPDAQRVQPGLLRRLAGAEVHLAGVRLSLGEGEPAVLTASSLLEVKTALNRLFGVLGTTAAIAAEWWKLEQDVVVVDGIYDPRRVPKGGVRLLIQYALDAVKAAPDLPDDARDVVVGELENALEELDRGKTPWSRVLSRVTQVTMVLAALVTIAGGVDDASENLVTAYNHSRQAIELIQDQAVVVRHTMPTPSDRQIAPFSRPLREDETEVEHD